MLEKKGAQDFHVDIFFKDINILIAKVGKSSRTETQTLTEFERKINIKIVHK